jgi:hypothetical protein
MRGWAGELVGERVMASTEGRRILGKVQHLEKIFQSSGMWYITYSFFHIPK